MLVIDITGRILNALAYLIFPDCSQRPLFVRSHFYTPSLSGEGWKLRVDGEVNNPLTLTLDDLRRLPSHTAVVTLECAGNGRAFFEPPVAGIQWEKGAVGTARWTGYG